MTEFTPVSGAVGGFLIGLAAVLFMAVNGRIAGISGIVAGILTPVHTKEERGEWALRAAFIAGLFLAPFLVWLATAEKPAVLFTHPVWLVALGGLLVGFGARLGGGCTSGHGVCGMARLSKRSIAATATFMATAIVTVFILHHLAGI